VAAGLYDSGGWSSICLLGAGLGALVTVGALPGLRPTPVTR